MGWMKRQDIITEDQQWRAPVARDQQFNVTVYGGGGSGSYGSSIFDANTGGAGGGSGERKDGSFTIDEGTEVECRVGMGGKGIKNATKVCDYAGYSIGKSGGTTSFGAYISANGGLGGYFNNSGDGAYDGGSAGANAQGNFYGFGVTDTVNGQTFRSGGGAPAAGARGIGGQANYCQGDGGTAAGGAGLFIQEVDNVVDRRIGSGGNGLILIQYYIPVGD